MLGNRIDDEQLEAELNKYLNDYHVDITAAKRGIIRKYGGADTGFATSANASKKVADLTGTEQNVDVTAKIVYVEAKEITVKGLSKTIVSGILGDDTGTASFTIWEPGSVQLDKGSVYNFRNCYCKLWNDRVQINIGNRGKIEAANGVEIEVPNTGASLSASDVKIGDIREGMGNVNVTGKILSVEARKINSRGEEKVVYSGIIADETGKVQYSAWHDFGLKEGEVVNAKNCYIRAWKGIPQLNIGDRAQIDRVDGSIDVDEGASVKTVAEVTRIGGGLDITVEGVIVDVKNGSGLIKRCPQCNRSLMNGLCTTHGAVDGVQDLRMKIVVDDGTGAIGAILNRGDTEKVTGISMASAQGLASARGEGVATRELTGRILLRKVRITGNVMSDDYGPSMIVRSADVVETDIQAEAEKLLAEVEGAI
ncbi:MAG: single-stranded DNA-binding protein [Thermoplasmata archaeon]|nr:single-stranded DNA-binding protein [Thermoplasmata archaeon]